MNEEATVHPFALKDCALVAIATGQKAENLRELRDQLLTIHPGSIYYHFWGGLLRPRFDDPQFNNDFAVWCHYALHDDILAERLAVLDPTSLEDLEALRQELVEQMDQRLDEIQHPQWVEADRQFHFLRSQIVVFDTGRKIERPEDLPQVITEMAVGSVFYHFVDARRRAPLGMDDFRAWLSGFGDQYETACQALASVDPYFTTLTDLRRQLADVLEACFCEE